MEICIVLFAAINFGFDKDHTPFTALLGVVVGVVAIISLIVNRKKLDEVDKSEKPKDEPSKVVGGPWKCPKCGEILEPQFESCWKCGIAKNDLA
jgi:hypothetical protein